MLDLSISESKQGNAASQDWGHRRYGSGRGRSSGRNNRINGVFGYEAGRGIVASEGDLFGLPSVVGDEVVRSLLEAPYVTAKQRDGFGCTVCSWTRRDVGDNFSQSLIDCRVSICRGSRAEADGTNRLSGTKGSFGCGSYPWTLCAVRNCEIDGFKICNCWVAANWAGLDQVWLSSAVYAVGELEGPARGVVLGCISTWLIPAHTDSVTVLEGCLIPLPASVSYSAASIASDTRNLLNCLFNACSRVMQRLEEGETLCCEGDLVVQVSDDTIPAIVVFEDVDGACAITEGGWRAVGYLSVKDVEASCSVGHYLFWLFDCAGLIVKDLS